MSRLSDTELFALREKFDDMILPAYAEGDLDGEDTDAVVLALDELRSLRALLATPMPCGWPVPSAMAERLVEWEPLTGSSLRLTDHNSMLDADEALALGAALIRAALEARGGK